MDPELYQYAGSTESYDVPSEEDTVPVVKKKTKGKKARAKRCKLYADSESKGSAAETKTPCQASSKKSRFAPRSQLPESSSSSESDENVDPDTRAGKLGRPKGMAHPRVINFNHPKAIKAINFRRDNVDEQCARLGVVYQRWKTEFEHITEHISVRNLNDDTIILEEQEMPSWCMLCPKNRYVNFDNGECHYLKWYHKTLVVIGEYKLLHCKCSQLCSHGNDMSARNAHYHCMQCMQPCRSTANLANHVIHAHRDVDLVLVQHLQKKPL